MPEHDDSLMLQFGRAADWLRALTGARWLGLETQGGRLDRQSAHWPATFRMSGLVLRTHTDLLVSGSSVDLDEEESFFLEVEPTACDGPRAVLAGARPPYLPVQKWPTLMTLAPSLLLDEHRQIEIGVASDGYDQLKKVPHVMWVAAKSRNAMLFVFADAEIPLDVFATTSEQTAALARTVLSTRATTAGFACRRLVLGGAGRFSSGTEVKP